MEWLCFLFFSISTVAYIWSGNNTFSKKEWWMFFLKFIAVFFLTILVTLLLKGLLSVWHFSSVAIVKLWLLKFFTSCLFFLGGKLGVVGLCTIFSNIFGFHKKYNPRYYPSLLSISKKTSPALIVLTKCLVSFGSILALYGIWLAQQ
ncbi:magnesium-transporting ATPase (P-type) [Erwinia persicina]|uniref:hypothetical protein n=1 Tax=Erwinia persicina TaxID=55211 RepID=UPI00209D0230|nr:hypothetical protein [Erwinia persicina]MCP1438327.1 magnesium-transporting ATPase (P-type) [Erwinia persicina]